MEELIAQVSYRPQPIKRPLPVNALYKRLTYEELIDFFETDPFKIKYPNREAKFTRNSCQLRAGQYGHVFHSVESRPAQTAQSSGSPTAEMPAEMPNQKPPPDAPPAKATCGGSSSSASGQFIGSKAYPPSGPPPPKAKAMATPSPPQSNRASSHTPTRELSYQENGIYGMSSN